MPDIWLQAVHGQDDPILLLKNRLQTLFLMQMQRHQFFIAMQAMFHGPFTDLHASFFQLRMDFCDASMFSIAQRSYQCNHIQSTFPVWQGPSTFFFWARGSLVAWALWSATATHHQRQTAQSLQRHDLSLFMVGN